MSEEFMCECCTSIVANGDDSACRDYYKHTHNDLDGFWVVCGEPVEAVDPVECAGCGRTVEDMEVWPVESM